MDARATIYRCIGAASRLFFNLIPLSMFSNLHYTTPGMWLSMACLKFPLFFLMPFHATVMSSGNYG